MTGSAAALRLHRQLRLEAGFTVEADDLVRSTSPGMPIEPRNFNRRWDRHVYGASVPDITVHDARRTCATLLRDLNVHPRLAQRVLRHAQVSITLEIHTEVG